MTSVDRLTRIAEHAATRVHPAPAGICGCGPCRHQIARIARRHGVDPAALTAALAARRPPVPPAHPHRRPIRPLTAAVGVSATVTVDGVRVSVADGLLALADRHALRSNRR